MRKPCYLDVRDRWGPTWSTVPAQRGKRPPWIALEGSRKPTTQEVYWEGQSIGGYGGWYVLGTRGSWRP